MTSSAKQSISPHAPWMHGLPRRFTPRKEAEASDSNFKQLSTVVALLDRAIQYSRDVSA
jgi:hypothetical protein